MLKLGNSAGKFPGNAGNNRLSSRHKRQVWLCEACDCSPAVFLCKADSAALCAACDSDIHSANPLARRHHRLPIPPSPLSPGLVMGLPEVDADDDFLTQEADETVDGEDEDEAASWLLLNPDKNGDNQINDNGPTSFGGVEDELLNFDDYSSCQNSQFNDQKQDYSVTQKSYGDDSFVPIQFHKRKNEVEEQYFQLGLDYESSNSGYNYPDSMSHNVALSPVDVGVVPESTMSGNSISHPRLPKGTIDLFSGAPIQTPTQLSPMDREARVLRYREKKKARKFEKTIRYASRKAYAETRPRIKGRFAKRRDVEVEVEQMFSTSQNAYGIVPSF